MTIQNSKQSPENAFSGWERKAGIFSLLVGLIVLSGWLFNNPVLKSFLPGFPEMKANTALAFFFAGLSLCLSSPTSRQPWVEVAAKGCAGLTLLLSLLNLVQYSLGLDLGIDEFLFRDLLAPPNSYPGRMAIITAVNFTLLGSALLLASQPRRRWLVEILALGALLNSLVTVIGYVYGVPELARFFPYSAVAIPTTITITALSLGILFASPAPGLMNIFRSHNLGGIMARQLIPAAIVIPVVLGWLLINGQRMGFYDSSVRAVLFTITTVISAVIILRWNAALLEHIDQIRHQTQARLIQLEERDAAEEKFRSLLDAAPDAMVIVNTEGSIELVNSQTERLFGYSRSEMIGQKIELIMPACYRESHPAQRTNFFTEPRARPMGLGLDLNGLRKDGSEFPVEISLSPIKTKEGIWVTAAIRDVTERKRADEALRESEEKFKYIFDHSMIGKSITYTDGTIHVNKAFCDMLGYSVEQLKEKKWQDITYPEDIEISSQMIAPLIKGEKDSARFTKRYLHKDGSVVWTDITTALRRGPDGQPQYFITALLDITERKQAEARIHDLLVFNETILNTAPVGMLTFQTSGQCVFANENAAFIIGATPDKLMTQNFRELESWKGSGLYMLTEQAIASGTAVIADVHHLSSFGKEIWLTASAVTFQSRSEELLLLTISDITERKRAEEALRESEEHYRLLFNQIRHGFALHEVICDEAGQPVDYRYLEINPAFETLTGLQASELIGRTVREALPGTESYWIEKFGSVAITGEPVEFSNYAQELDKYYEVSAYCPKRGQFAVIFMDVTERKLAEEALQRTSEELRRSNSELEQFAYVASHDLQEPLRMVASYVQLIAKRYHTQLEPEALEFMAFAVDGAKRMQNLINDLLAYSRVGTRGHEFTEISGEELLNEALLNLQLAIEESNAHVTHDVLPIVKGDPIQLVAVFQNLLSNAIKFRGAEPPCIHVGVQHAETEWIFSVRDNGIGIDPQFADRIFVIFQRLNDRTEYSGTGIGLAICKRVVLRHGGRVWVEAQLGKGSTFYFTLPFEEGKRHYSSN
jgi:PAS domain S-box-containing protein